MIDKNGYYCCRKSGTHWTIDGISDRTLWPASPYDAKDVRLPEAEKTLLAKRETVSSLFLKSDAPTASEAIPHFLKQLPHLCSLTLPSQIASSLRPEMLGTQVKELNFHGRYDKRYWNNKTVALSSEAIFTGIESLTGAGLCHRVETRFRFEPACFPNLRSLHFTFDTKRQFATTLRALPHLIVVNVAAFDTIESLADLLPCQELVSLTLSWNRKIETLAGIERFPNLRCLKLGSLTQLKNLDAIATLQRLEHVGIYWSKNVEAMDALLELPLLKSIAMFGNGPEQPFWQRLKQEAYARGIAINGSIVK